MFTMSMLAQTVEMTNESTIMPIVAHSTAEPCPVRRLVTTALPIA